MTREISMLVAALLVCSGCGVKTVYNNADRFARWAVSDYIEMTPEQRDYFDLEIDRLLYWHRTTHLPLYAEFLETLPAVLADGTDTREVTGMTNAMFAWSDEIEAHSIPMASQILRSLTDEQVADLPGRLARGNEELLEDEVDLTVDEAREAWWQEFADDFARLTGRLNDAQRKYLAAQALRYLPYRVLWVEYRARWQGDLLKLLQQRDDAQVFDKGFVGLMAARKQYYGAELTGVFDSNEALYRDVTVWLLNNLTEQQRERLLNRTADLAADFRELAVAAPGAGSFDDACLVDC